MFTGPGTNSYLIGHKDISLVDPGPLQENRLDKIVAGCGSNLKRVLVTHTHKDHSPGAAYLQKKYSLPVFGQRVQNDDGLQDKHLHQPENFFMETLLKQMNTPLRQFILLVMHLIIYAF